MQKTSAFVLLLAGLALAGCYNTNGLVNGGLLCGTKNSCPSGYTCQVDATGSVGHCWKNGTHADAGPGPGSDAPSICSVGALPYGPFPSCTVQSVPNSTCDPVCQSGCACNRRCVIDEKTNTSFVCEAAASAATFIPPLGSCEGNTSMCAPGSVCIDDTVCSRLCYRTCRLDQDCGSTSRCTASTIVDAQNQGVKNLFFCSPPVEVCNPTGAAACASPRGGFKCVFLSGMVGVAKDDATVCDCSSLHTQPLGQKCTVAPDNCQPGTVCVSGTCHSICSLKASGSACPSGGGCTPVYNSQNYGYCR